MKTPRPFEGITRRSLIRAAAVAGLTASGPGSRPARAASARPRGRPFILTTWDFGPGANAVGFPFLARGGSALDAVEAAINSVELLPDEYWVGYGGVPNEVGETTLDAMIMWGPTHDAGAVGCLKRIKRAISVARQVMEKTQHTLLVGDDATRFAVRMGFSETSLTNSVSQAKWEAWAAKKVPSDAFEPEPFEKSGPKGHDTVGSIAVDAEGHLCVGCSTNGRELKIPGRVGDSPIPGAGAYCDQDVGAAVATGNGDVMMRFLPTYHAVESMRRGRSPADAARDAIHRITSKGYKLKGGIAVVSIDGRHGGAHAGWDGQGFSYSIHDARGNKKYPVST